MPPSSLPRRRRATLLGLALALALASGAAPAQAAVRKVAVRADSVVGAHHPRTTGGDEETLRVDGKPATRTYLRFRITGLSGRIVTRASLWLHLDRRERWRGVQAATTNGRSWSQRRLIWRTRPAAAPAAGSIAPASGRWRKIDVTPLVRTNGTVDVVLTTTRSTAVAFDSREAGRKVAPRLHLVTAADAQPAFPLRTAVYDPEEPATPRASTTVYHPTRTGNDLSAVVAQQDDLAWGGFAAALTQWEGEDTPTDERLGVLLKVADATRSPLRWAATASAELLGNPSRADIAELLRTLDVEHGRDPAYLRVHGRPVVFVPLAPGDGCGSLRRWVAGNARQRFYLVYQTWPGFEQCTDARPSDWFALAPDGGMTRVRAAAASISPGFYSAEEAAARKVRDLPRWYADVRALGATGARWQIVDSLNDWSDGTAVQPATEWASPDGHGQYLDALHANGVEPPDTATVAAAVGDIGCSVSEQAANDGSSAACQAAATEQVAAAFNPAFVITMGDDMHGQATLDDYDQDYEPNWGALKAITYPAVGNHQYCSYQCADPVGAVKAGYFTYWGARAGTPGEGWYSYDDGGWHFIVLNSECKEQGGCGTGSPMESWLRLDLAAHPTPCTLAYWHRPRFTGGHEGEAPSMGPIWGDLYRAGVELVLNGHQHQYERFRPQAPDRSLDLSGGITEIVSGTGGRSHIAPVLVRANTVVQNADTFGVLRLELHPLRWSARFTPAPGLGSFTDDVSGDCH